MSQRFTLIPTVYVLLRRGHEVLLLKRANSGYQDGKYSLVAGHLDGDELATDALVREAKEEAGIDINPAQLRFVHLGHRLSRPHSGEERLDLFFETTIWDGEITNREPHKCDELAWYPLSDLPEDTIPYVRNVLHDIQRGIAYSEYTHEPK